MPLFEHTDRLVRVLRILHNHQQNIADFYSSILVSQVHGGGIQKLKDAFRASVSEHRGASFDRGNEAVQAFDARVATIFRQVNALINVDPEEAHRVLFESIVTLPNIDQKIAAMFIKFLVVYLDVWPAMLPYLYVPVDRVVLKILGEKLQVYVGDWKYSPSVKNPSGKLYVRGNNKSAQYARFIAFQTELAEIAGQAHVHRILVDEAWFIGHIFCNEYPLCHRCWAEEFCQDALVN